MASSSSSAQLPQVFTTLKQYKPAYGPEIFYHITLLDLLQLVHPLRKFLLPGQRHINEAFVDDLIESQTVTYQALGYCPILSGQFVLGQCSCAECTEINEYGIFIVDGQHRLSALKKLCKELNDVSLYDTTIDVVFIQRQHEFLRDKFRAMAQHCLPCEKYWYETPMQKVVNSIWGWFESDYGKLISKSQKTCQRPNINKKHLIEGYSASKYFKTVLKDCQGDTEKCAEQCIKNLKHFNKYLEELYSAKDTDKFFETIDPDCKSKMSDKASVYRMHLGLFANGGFIDASFRFVKRRQEAEKSKRGSLKQKEPDPDTEEVDEDEEKPQKKHLTRKGKEEEDEEEKPQKKHLTRKGNEGEEDEDEEEEEEEEKPQKHLTRKGKDEEKRLTRKGEDEDDEEKKKKLTKKTISVKIVRTTEGDD
jgi:hypothetical protein